jgi:hypothetical protein
MPSKRVNPYLIKTHRSYTAAELAKRLGVHKNTVRNWQREGLPALGDLRPVLFQGRAVRGFLAQRNADRKRPCPPGAMYCFRCREARRPALGRVDYLQQAIGTGNLSAMCEACGTMMHRRARGDTLGRIMPGVAVTIREASPRLRGRHPPSPNCDMEKEISA